ncbi:hypothetical protein CHS0354_014210 [Potamilus streckersoni]|uniref:2-aminoethanethiol dioxygenase n=1 Tax=Potamilus streckersoni TaxID=2493646 RepID=A0AAE0SZ87_9BIVA|nr:hypothetical protein CHS0354_014210 [Potamilus streckersoni]
MSAHIQKVAQAAYKLFSRLGSGVKISPPYEGLYEVAGLFSQLREPDVFEPNSKLLYRDRKLLPDIDEAPVTYVPVWDDKVLTICMFILKKGSRLPMHDHPNMYGLLKVLHGSLTITSYSPYLDHSPPLPPTLAASFKYANQIKPVKPMGKKTISASDDCVVLTPESGNYHEITAESGQAAFIDILAPPYDSSDRQCTYYSVIPNQDSVSDITYLIKVHCPTDYWCNEEQYTGPDLHLHF